jgi:hypothetical protein
MGIGRAALRLSAICREPAVNQTTVFFQTHRANHLAAAVRQIADKSAPTPSGQYQNRLCGHHPLLPKA